MTQVNLATQVVDFCGSLAPQPRRKLRLALRKLAREQGDIKSLEGSLVGYHRLRSGSYRVIFTRRLGSGKPQIDCIFAEHRSLVYEIFSAAAWGRPHGPK